MLRTVIMSCLVLMIISKGLLIKYPPNPPITWSYHSGKVSDDTYEVDVDATLRVGWGVFSLNTEEGLPTTIIFEPNKDIKLIDSLEEKGNKDYSTIFNVEFPPPRNKPGRSYKIRKFYQDCVIFSQNFVFKGTAKTTILKGIVQWQGFNNDTILPPNSEFFEIPIKRQ